MAGVKQSNLILAHSRFLVLAVGAQANQAESFGLPHFKKETEEDLKVFVAHHDPFTGPGYLASPKIEQTKTVFGLLMALVDVGFMKPDDMSNLIEFLESSHKKSLVTEVQKFQAQAKRSEHNADSTNNGVLT